MNIGSGGEVIAAGDVTLTFWSAKSGGLPYTDLLDGGGATVTSITSADGTGLLPVGTIPEFQGPDSVTAMWAEPVGGTTRYKMIATDLGSEVSNLTSRVATLEAETSDFDSAPAWVRRDPATGVWPDRPATSRWTIWVDTLPETPSPPVIGGTGMVDGLDMYWGSA
ncbi:hypothetical protein [Actinomadura sp. GTD37]|uniref:hypothetical protein n=1 Tax=Actinomadura sp. GTD37 TaxID=1778030 RepID=UPI0035C0F810